MARRKKRPRKNQKKTPDLHIRRAVLPGNYVLEDIRMTNVPQGVVIGDGPTPPREDLPADFVIHGPTGPMMIDAESRSRTMITGEGSIEELQGRLVHRPRKGKVFGYRRAEKSILCICGREFYSFSTTCSSCGRRLKK